MMKLDEKKDLVRLLTKYQHEMQIADGLNRSLKTASDMLEWQKPYRRNARSQYEHARLIVSQLSRKIGAEMLKKEQL